MNLLLVRGCYLCQVDKNIDGRVNGEEKMAESDKDWYEYLAWLTCISVGHVSNCYDSFIDIDNILGSMAY